MASFGQASQQYQGSGPYRRIWSGTPCSAMSATVTLPGNGHGISYQGTSGDTAFVYSGGWGSGGQAVDAGFMHNPGSDTWSVFLKTSGAPEYLGDNANIRLVPNGTTQVTFRFWIPQDGSLRIEATGDAIDVNTGSLLGPQTIALQLDGVPGFTADGANMILKRMTSIAQNMGKENLQSGSSLTGVTWSNVQFGTDISNLTDWSIVPPGGTMSYPHGPQVLVDYKSDTWETVSINLT